MCFQVDAEGFPHSLLDSILDFKKDDNAVDKENMYFTTKRGQCRARNTTSGWKLLVLRKNSTEQWTPLSVMKNYKPLDVAEFSVTRGVDLDLAFIWWFPYIIRRCEPIIAGFNSLVKHVTHNYGVKLPRTVQEAYYLDEKNGNMFWCNALNR